MTIEKDTSVVYFLDQSLLLDNSDLYFKISNYLTSKDLNPSVNESIIYCRNYYLRNQNNIEILFDPAFNSLFYSKTLYYLFTNTKNTIPVDIKECLIGLLKIIVFKNTDVDNNDSNYTGIYLLFYILVLFYIEDQFQKTLLECLAICNTDPTTLQKKEFQDLKEYSLSNITIATGVLEWISHIWSGKEYSFDTFYHSTNLPPFLLSLTKEIFNKHYILINRIIELFLYIINDTVYIYILFIYNYK